MSWDRKKQEEEDEDYEPAPTLYDALSELYLSPKFADVYFRVGTEGERIPAHRIILASASPVFETMLFPQTIANVTAEVKADSSHEEDDIVLSDVPVVTFKKMLEVIYLDRTTITAENVCTLLEGSQKLLGDSSSALKFIAENFSEVVESKDFVSISRDALRSVVKHNYLCGSELEIFNACHKWAIAECKRRDLDLNGTNKRQALGDVVLYIRFPLLSLTDLTKHVQSTGILTDDELFDLFTYLGAEEKKKPRIPFSAEYRQGGAHFQNTTLLTAKQEMALNAMMPKMYSNKGWKLLYRGTRDGMVASVFHSKCDYKTPNVVIIKAKTTNNIFGGFTTASWAGSGYKTDSSAFLFSIVNKTGRPKPIKLTCNRPSEAIYASNSQGPTFGGGYNLFLGTDFTATTNTTSTYDSYHMEDGSTEPTNLLAGAHSFACAEVEVYTPSTEASSAGGALEEPAPPPPAAPAWDNDLLI